MFRDHFYANISVSWIKCINARVFGSFARIGLLLFAAMLGQCLGSGVEAARFVEDCAKYTKNADLKKTAAYYGYRLKPGIAAHGCGAILVYHAFGNEHGMLLDLAEDDDAMMRRLIAILEAVPGLAEMLHDNPRLTRVLDLRLGNEETKNEFWQILEKLNAAVVQAARLKQPEIAALAILLPNISPTYLQKNFNRQQLALLPNLIGHAGLASSVAQIEGMEELLPFITTNPADSLAIYKKVLEAWGNVRFARLAQESPQAVGAAVPPLTQASLNGLNPLNSQPARFHRMQEEYIRLYRDLYCMIENEQGPAWATEFCTAFADLLPMALLGPDTSDGERIRKLLLDLSRSDLFSRLLKPSACFEETNVALLGKLLGKITTVVQPLSSRIHALTALADWHADGTLMPLIQTWLPFSSPENFSISFKKALSEDRESDLLDAQFWMALVNLAMQRSELTPSQQRIFDTLAQDLMHKEVNPAATLGFLAMVSEPVFRILQPGKFNQPYEVARRLLLSGYPESADSSIYEAYLRGERLGTEAHATQAIEKRGSLPEGILLIDGQTFADRHGGYSAWELAETAVDTAYIAASITASVMSAGAATPLVGGAVARIGAKQAARQAARLASRMLTRSSKITPRTMRSIGAKSVKLLGRSGGIRGTKSSDLAKVAENIEEKLDALSDAIGIYRTVYLALNPVVQKSLPRVEAAVEVCPEKEGEKER